MSNNKHKGKGKKKLSEKEEKSESWCFECKDGGELIVCDHKNCYKVYHTSCLGKDDSFIGVESWACARHYCFECKDAPFAYCLGCPNSVCGLCWDATGFTFVRDKKGLCINCWDLVWIIENNLQQDEEGNTISMAGDTAEGLFKEYWEIIKKKEGLRRSEISAAIAVKPIYKLDENSRNLCVAEDKIQDAVMTRDSDDDYMGKHKQTKRDSDEDYMGKQKQIQRYTGEDYIYLGKHKPIKRGCEEDYMNELKPIKRKRSNDIEFLGWGSKPLLTFLASIGKCFTEPMTEWDVQSVICEYIKEKKLEKPKDKRKFFPDEKLFPIFRKKVMPKHQIYHVLESHIAQSSDDDSSWEDNDSSGENVDHQNKNSSADKDLNDGLAFMKSRLSSLKKRGRPSVKKPVLFMKANDQPTFMESRLISLKKGRLPMKKGDLFKKPSSFASICADNIKLIYLKQSLVLELAKQPESFMGKVVGSFVRVKMDTGELRRPYHLVRVLVVAQPVPDEMSNGILLEVSFMSRAIPISELSDDDFTEEECENLKQKVKEGSLQKFTVEELQEKANSLHEDITKHNIATRLANLQILIDRASLRGRHKEKSDLLDEREELQQPGKQEKLLRTMPSVVREGGIEAAFDPDEETL